MNKEEVTTLEELKTAKQLLRKALDYLEPSNIVHPVYIPPAQQLRNRADEMDAQEKFLNEVKMFLGLPTNITF